ncbi:uncharacterized protein [Palaemon carinicauda]|uniref:uncharacterized protein n=1 Tax=Palaemon carinicauda TaxID=392227 RepID=UPI0035B67AB6
MEWSLAIWLSSSEDVRTGGNMRTRKGALVTALVTLLTVCRQGETRPQGSSLPIADLILTESIQAHPEEDLKQLDLTTSSLNEVNAALLPLGSRRRNPTDNDISFQFPGSPGEETLSVDSPSTDDVQFRINGPTLATKALGLPETTESADNVQFTFPDPSASGPNLGVDLPAGPGQGRAFPQKGSTGGRDLSYKNKVPNLDSLTLVDVSSSKLGGGEDFGQFGGSVSTNLGIENKSGGSGLDQFGGSDSKNLGGSGLDQFGGSGSAQFGGSDSDQFGRSGIDQFGGRGSTQFGGSDSTQFGGSGLDQLGGSGSTPFGGTDSTRFGESDSTQFGGSESTQFGGGGLDQFRGIGLDKFGGSDSTQFGKSDSTQFEISDLTQFGKSDSTQFEISDLTQFGESDLDHFGGSGSTQFGGSAPSQFGRGEFNQFGGDSTIQFVGDKPQAANHPSLSSSTNFDVKIHDDVLDSLSDRTLGEGNQKIFNNRHSPPIDLLSPFLPGPKRQHHSNHRGSNPIGDILALGAGPIKKLFNIFTLGTFDSNSQSNPLKELLAPLSFGLLGGGNQGGLPGLDLSAIGLGEDAIGDLVQVASSGLDDLARETSAGIRLAQDEVRFQANEKVRQFINNLQQTGRTVGAIGQNTYRSLLQKKDALAKLLVGVVTNLGRYINTSVGDTFEKVGNTANVFGRFFNDLKVGLLNSLIAKGENVRELVSGTVGTVGSALRDFTSAAQSAAEDNIRAITGLKAKKVR